MKIGVLGYGQMGRIIKAISLKRGHSVVSVDPGITEADLHDLSDLLHEGVDICIDFSTPKSAVPNIVKVISAGVGIVVGTTGWYEKLPEILPLVQEKKTALIYSPNFSVGVNLFGAIVQHAAKIIDRFDSYDVSAIELHHKYKIDSPSGTAKAIGEIILENMTRKKRLTFDRVDRRIDPDELHIASVRGGEFPGTHEILLDSAADTISLKHTARNREGFALGAILAAEWLKDKKGVFDRSDFIKKVLGLN